MSQNTVYLVDEMLTIANDVVEDFYDIGLNPPVENTTFDVDTRLCRVYGKCIAKRNRGGEYTFKILISSFLMEEGTVDGIKSTIAHEIIHTMCPSDHHGRNFKRLMHLINSYDLGYKVTVYGTDEESGITSDRYKYKVKCENCDHEWKYFRMGKVVKHPEYYHCACGGKLKK